MDTLWPWLAMAGMGALHGLNPAAGWACAAAWSLRPGDGRAQPLRALLPIAVGHAASVALVVAAVMWGWSLPRTVLQALAGGLLVAAVVLHLWRRTPRAVRATAGHAGLALGSFIMSMLHGAGLMLVPALAPLCLDSGAAGQGMGTSGPLLLACAAAAVHMAAMLAVTGLMAVGACRGVGAGLRMLRQRRAGSG